MARYAASLFVAFALLTLLGGGSVVQACGEKGEPSRDASLRQPAERYGEERGVADRTASPGIVASQGVTTGFWSLPQLVLGGVSTEATECAPAISFQGDRLFFEREVGPYGRNDIFVSFRTDSGWSAPVNLGPPVNTEEFSEGKPYVTASGDTLLFVRQGDIYMSVWDEKSGNWGEPAPFSDAINDPEANETSPCLSRDGREFYFVSDRSGGYGWDDIYVSYRTENGWSEPVNIGPTVNTSENEWYCVISPDGQDLYFVTSRPGGYGNVDLWVSHREGDGWSLPVNLGGLVNTSSVSCRPSISASGDTLYFGGARPGEGMGDLDIWFTTWVGGDGR
jgi:hypothetical protein